MNRVKERLNSKYGELEKIDTIEDIEQKLLWKYTDVPTFIRCLQLGSMPFISTSLFSDRSEALLLKKVLGKIDREDGYKSDVLFNLIKKQTKALCLCEHKDELIPMWERFSEKNGIVMKMNTSNLIRSFNGDTGFIAKRVKYIKKEDLEILSELNSISGGEISELGLDFFFYKLDTFQDEREVRVIHKNPIDWQIQLLNLDESGVDTAIRELNKIIKMENCVYYTADPIEDLIIEAYMSPFSYGEFLETVNVMKLGIHFWASRTGLRDVNKINIKRSKFWGLV